MTKIVEETIEDLENLGYGESDILWVGSRDGEFAMSWADFKDKFNDLEYDSGYGAQEIAADLVVVGKNWWLEREEYDGAERWVYKKYPKIVSGKSFDKIIGGWDNLAKINIGGESKPITTANLEEFAADLDKAVKVKESFMNVNVDLCEDGTLWIDDAETDEQLAKFKVVEGE